MSDKAELIGEIARLRKSKDAVVLAHYYVNDEIQEIADYVGDSFQLAKQAQAANSSIIVFCGVRFMGESAKVLNPSKKVLMPTLYADCPLAHMISVDKIESVRAQYKDNPEDFAVVAYINTSAEVKAYSDVCVTSSNAADIVRRMPQHNIFFIPDKNLGSYIKKCVPEKNIILNDGFCHVHENIYGEDIAAAKKLYPNAEVLIHPECNPSAVPYADFIGSTKAIIEQVKRSPHNEFIIGTEIGIFHQLKKARPDAAFYEVCGKQICQNMKLNMLELLYKCLRDESPEIVLDSKLLLKAKKPLERMLELSK